MNCPIKDRIVAGYAQASPSDKVAIAGVALAAAKFAPVSTFGGQVAVAGAVAIGALLWFGGRACCAGCADAAAGASPFCCSRSWARAATTSRGRTGGATRSCQSTRRLPCRMRAAPRPCASAPMLARARSSATSPARRRRAGAVTPEARQRCANRLNEILSSINNCLPNLIEILDKCTRRGIIAEFGPPIGASINDIPEPIPIACVYQMQDVVLASVGASLFF